MTRPMNMLHFLSFTASCLVTSAIILFNPTPAAAADSCDPIFSALTKVVTTPSHSYSTHTMLNGSKITSSETIYVQNKVYMRVNGKWMEGPDSPSQILQEQQESRKSGRATCQLVRNESVNGESTGLYSLHSESDYGKEDSQMWISTHTGLPLREEIDMNTGGIGGKSHVSTRYEYANVQAPKM